MMTTSAALHLCALLLLALCALAPIASANPSCPPGTFRRRSGAGVGSKMRCEQCLPGTYAVLPNSDSCTKCPAHTFSSARGMRVRRTCFPCPANSTSPPGSTACTPCPGGGVQLCNGKNSRKCLRCARGTYFDKLSCACRPCEDDTTTLGLNERECLEKADPATGFAPGQRFGDREIWRVNATCPPGYDAGVHTDCLICGFNRFRTASMPRCEECPFGRVTVSWREPSTRCVECPPGRYVTDLTRYTVTNEQTPICVGCPSGWTTSTPGNALCHRQGAPRGSRCPANAFETASGDCTVCDANSRFDAATKSCMRCPHGSTAPRGVSNRCTRCWPFEPAEFFPGREFASCDCRNGETLIARHDGTLACAPCPDGEYARGSGRCEKCPQGLVPRVVADDDSEIACVPCPPGRVVFLSRCVRAPPACPNGFVRAPRGVEKYMREGVCVSARTSCPVGTRLRKVPSGKLFCFRGWGARARVVCPGRDERYNGRDACVSCAVNERLVRKAGVLECMKCPAGTVSSGGKAMACGTCTGSLRQSSKLSNACICPPGRFVDRADGSKCKRCPVGSFNNDEGMTECQPCGKGFNKKEHEDGPIECTCPRGRVVNVEGDCVVDSFQSPEYSSG